MITIIIMITVTFRCEWHFPSHASHTCFQMRVMLSFRCGSHFPSHASPTFFHMRVPLSFRCESYFLSGSSHTFLQMRVTLSFICESRFRSDASHTFVQMRVALSYRCESHVLSDASQTFWKWRGGWCESKEETGVKVRRRLVWEWGGNWSISDYLQGTIWTLTGMQARSTLVCISNSAWIADVIRSVQTHAREADCDYCETTDFNQGSRVAHPKHERTKHVVTLRCSEGSTYMVVSHVMQLADLRSRTGCYSDSERKADM